jgi:hypothetical protein
MKEHISITIDAALMARIRKYAKQEHRAISQFAEVAINEYLNKHYTIKSEIITSKSRFSGSFSRQETYER